MWSRWCATYSTMLSFKYSNIARIIRRQHVFKAVRHLDWTTSIPSHCTLLLKISTFSSANFLMRWSNIVIDRRVPKQILSEHLTAWPFYEPRPQWRRPYTSVVDFSRKFFISGTCPGISPPWILWHFVTFRWKLAVIHSQSKRHKQLKP